MSKIQAEVEFWENPTYKELIEHLKPFSELTLKFTSITYKNKKLSIVLEENK